MSKEVIFNVREITQLLDTIEPGFKKQMVREMKAIAKPTANEIGSEIRAIQPLSGFSVTPTSASRGGTNSNPTGTYNWQSGKYKGNFMKPDNVLIRYRQNRSKRSAITSLVSIWVRSPMVAIVGIAGKGSGIPRRAETREYAYKGGRRSHRLNGQGAALIKQVRANNWFNFFYRTADKTMPDVEREIKSVWDSYSSKVTRKF